MVPIKLQEGLPKKCKASKKPKTILEKNRAQLACKFCFLIPFLNERSQDSLGKWLVLKLRQGIY